MEHQNQTYEGKSRQELSAILRAYLTGKQNISAEDVLPICQTLAAMETPEADPLDIYRNHLAACFPDAVKATS